MLSQREVEQLEISSWEKRLLISPSRMLTVDHEAEGNSVQVLIFDMIIHTHKYTHAQHPSKQNMWGREEIRILYFLHLKCTVV